MSSKNCPRLKTITQKNISAEFVKSVTGKQRVIVECPEKIAGVELGEPTAAKFERTVTVSDFFAPALPAGRILMQHQCWYSPVLSPVKAHLSLAKVSGYRTLAFGFPSETFPILFEHPDNPNILVATSSLSNFIEGRFAPKEDWQIVIGRLLAWLEGKDGIVDVDWEMTVRPTFNRDDKLPANAEQEALERNIAWFNDHMFFEHAGEIGVFEGYLSAILPNGRQYLRPKTRADCSGEATMVTALDWALNKSHPSHKMTDRIMHYLFNGPELYDNDPTSQTYGGLRFYEFVPAYYSEGRAPLACIFASELSENYSYAKKILRNLLSLLRTTGPQGFRISCLRNPGSFDNGRTWKYYQETDYTECRPHYNASMWAAFLQAYVLTGHEDFLVKTKSALKRTMEIFPDFLWQNGMNGDYARLLLPLAFLVEIEDTKEHRQWLRKVAEKLLESALPCGGIQEKMGKPELGKYPAPRSNEDYASNEAALVQKNGDPVIDMIYTANFAFIGLHEAFFATGEEIYRTAADKLAEFFCRVQCRSEEHKFLDGAWMHGFDYEQWDFFGNPADFAWGPWCVESGWTNTWISATLGLRALNRPMLCRKNSEEYKQWMPGLLEEMTIVHSDDDNAGKTEGRVPGND